MIISLRPSRLSFILFSLAILAVHAAKKDGEELATSIRATSCIANTTHCHCSLTAANANSVCLKPTSGTGTTCSKGSCAAGYRCDCDASSICEKEAVSSYRTTDTMDSETVACTVESVMVPKTVVGQTSDFYVEAYQEFQLFVNEQEIGYGESDESKVLTAEIKSGDVIAVIAKRKSADSYGVKLRFVDVQSEVRMIDENWYATSTLQSSWLDKRFDPVANGWASPSIASTVTADGFDKNVPWMWYGTAETAYFRYVIP